MVKSKLISYDTLKAKLIRFKVTKKVLLINPLIQDYRLPWDLWHKPLGLLQLASFLADNNVDCKLIDLLHEPKGKRITRRKVEAHQRGTYSIDLWEFGTHGIASLEHQLNALIESAWRPQFVLVTSLNSVWWRGVAKTINLTRKLLPNVPIILGGAYPTYAADHAKLHSGADCIVSGRNTGLARYSPLLSLYESTAKSAGFLFYRQTNNSRLLPRPMNEIIHELQTNLELGITEFVLFDEQIHDEHRAEFSALLKAIYKVGIKAKFVLQGNISPSMIDKRFAARLKMAGVTKIHLRANLDFNTKDYYTDHLKEYERCMRLLVDEALYPGRQGAIAAMLPIGLPFEDLPAVTSRLISLAHIVGSVIPVPFQYVPQIHERFSFGWTKARANGHNKLIQLVERLRKHPESFNGKLFPFAELSGYEFEEYVEVIRLAALLNSKYRGTTFDFIGESFTSRRFRESIQAEAWNPFKESVPHEEIILPTL